MYIIINIDARFFAFVSLYGDVLFQYSEVLVIFLSSESADFFFFFVGWLFGVYRISNFVGYLTPNPYLYK